MSLDRKDFLKFSILGGIGVAFGGTAPASLLDRGTKLVPVKRQSLVMGSVISFDVLAESEQAGHQAINKAVKVFRKFNNTFSMYNPESEMARLAKHAGKQEILLSKAAAEVLAFAKQVYTQSGGLFDITIEPAMQLWGFRKDRQEPIERPSDEQLKRLEQVIGSDKLQIEGSNALLKHAGMAIDTGGIAGGYALDRAVNEMKKCDIASAFINFSGDIAAFGEPLHGKKWEVHIIDPNTAKPVNEPLYLKDQSLSTSGSYQNRRENSAKDSWGHLLSPASSKPVEPVGSLTAIHSSAMMADAWSTAGYIGSKMPKDIQTIIL